MPGCEDWSEISLNGFGRSRRPEPRLRFTTRNASGDVPSGLQPQKCGGAVTGRFASVRVNP